MARRRGRKIATTAIARKLLTRAWHLLTDAEHTTIPQAAATASAPRTGDAVTDPEGPQAPGDLVNAHEPAMPRSEI
jgi:hypothetical protein